MHSLLFGNFLFLLFFGPFPILLHTMYYFCTCSTLLSPLPALDPTLQGYLVSVTVTARSGKSQVQTGECFFWCCLCPITQDQVYSIIEDDSLYDAFPAAVVIFHFSVLIEESLPPSFRIWKCEVVILGCKLFSNLGPQCSFLHLCVAYISRRHLVAAPVHMSEPWNTAYQEQQQRTYQTEKCLLKDSDDR